MAEIIHPFYESHRGAMEAAMLILPLERVPHSRVTN
jgi:hypothetical protein